jgi:transcriptional regulator with XRE-family HTH domain
MGRTQVQLAVESGVDRSHISDIERGKANPSLVIIETLALTFGVAVTALLA